MGNQKRPPLVHPIRQIQLAEPQRYDLDNGIPLYAISMGTQEVLKLEIVFKSGRPYEQKKLAARATTRLLREGTHSFSGKEIAEKIDYYGATLTATFSIDTGCLTLYCLPRHLPHVLPVLRSVLMEPTFPDHELQTFISNNVERLKIELSKPDVVAYRTITEMVFGAAHSYGYNSTPETYQALTREDVIKHHQQTFLAGNAAIFVSGLVSETMIHQIRNALQDAFRPGYCPPTPGPIIPADHQSVHIQEFGYNQTSIRIGRRVVPRRHADFTGLYVLNTILGGYFGSKLMTNIREQKGYTYNIYSSIDSFLHEGFFYISTEVNNDKLTEAQAEVWHEIDMLSQQEISVKELDMAKNYLLGYVLTLLDGPFNTAQIIKGLVLQGMTYSDFSRFVEEIRTIDPKRLQQLARTYLQKEDLYQVMAS